MFTTCTLYLQGILGSSEDTLALRRILEDLCVQRGGLEDMPPAPGAAFQHRYHFAGMENHGAMPADLSDFLIAKDLSFVWIAAAQAGHDCTLTLRTPTVALCHEPLTSAFAMFLRPDEANDPERVASVQHKAAVMQSIIDGPLFYAPTAHLRLTIAAEHGLLESSTTP